MTKFSMQELAELLNATLKELERRNEQADSFLRRSLAWQLLDMHHEGFKAYERYINKLMDQLDGMTAHNDMERVSEQLDIAIDEQQAILDELLNKAKKVFIA